MLDTKSYLIGAVLGVGLTSISFTIFFKDIFYIGYLMDFGITIIAFLWINYFITKLMEVKQNGN